MNVEKDFGLCDRPRPDRRTCGLLLKQQAEENEGVESSYAVNTDKGHAKVTKAVKKTLREHDGEASPVVQAFQEALNADK